MDDSGSGDVDNKADNNKGKMRVGEGTKRGSSSNHKAASAKNANGNVDQLKEERRDLYDLLYGDEQPAAASVGDDDQPVSSRFTTSSPTTTSSKLASVFALEDENLDAFDPYGLEDS